MLEIQFLNSKSSKNLKLFNVLKTTHILQQLSVILYKYCLHLFEFAPKYTHKFEELKLATFWQLLLKRVFVRTLYWGGGGGGGMGSRKKKKNGEVVHIGRLPIEEE